VHVLHKGRSHYGALQRLREIVSWRVLTELETRRTEQLNGTLPHGIVRDLLVHIDIRDLGHSAHENKILTANVRMEASEKMCKTYGLSPCQLSVVEEELAELGPRQGNNAMLGAMS
jgi:hypothetical protein